MRLPNERSQLFHRQITQRIHSNDLGDLLHTVMAGDEVFPGINVSAIVTGIQEGARTPGDGPPEPPLPEAG